MTPESPRAAAHGERLTAARRLVHALVVLAGWVLFVWGWERVASGQPAVGELLWLIVGALVLVPALTLSWVLHNVGIYRRKGPRRSSALVALDYTHDFNGRRIDADWTALASARRVLIRNDGGHKRFENADPAPAAPTVPAAAPATPLPRRDQHEGAH
ncbi:hypothetical protein IWX58_002226 [Rubrivivax gelatinosus]|uniref:hypothetical protein n=1 Tax=Rubrivivax gelatinosus TaxID=28068 RepID=UPI001A334ADF|nr:hypothetical protein [Rubrivivax gelatinosus]MBG6080539.1 hypothetical protein [Rubrivivax gelatinosus]